MVKMPFVCVVPKYESKTARKDVFYYPTRLWNATKVPANIHWMN